MLSLVGRVAEAWWRLWSIRRARGVQRDQLVLAGGLIEAARARLEVGRASLADVAQLELMQARLDDRLRSLDESERSAEAQLREAIAADEDVALPIEEEVSDATLPGEDLASLSEAARAHPQLEAFELRAQGHEAMADAAEATRFPSFVLGVDWIETGDAPMPTNGSGDDALIVSLGVSVPIFGQDAAGDLQRAAEADGAAERAAVSRLTQAWSTTRDAHRRLRLFETTLLPQARAAYESVTGSYATGERSVATSLAAQRTFLEIELDTIRVRAQHGMAWARLEALAGRPIETGGER